MNNARLNDCLSDLEQISVLQCKDVILGVIAPKQQADVIHFVILQAKWYIVRKNINMENVVFKEFNSTQILLQTTNRGVHIQSER